LSSVVLFDPLTAGYKTGYGQAAIEHPVEKYPIFEITPHVDGIRSRNADAGIKPYKLADGKGALSACSHQRQKNQAVLL